MRLRFSAWTVPLALFAACLFSYGLLIPWLGFYWDDWAYLYLYHTAGPLGYIPFLAGDRPFSPLIHILTTALLGTQPLGYHLLNLLLRWGTALALWGLIGQVWPQLRQRLLWVPFLFVAYPGFLQQPIPLIYNLHWVNYFQTVLSLAVMAWAVRSGSRYWLKTLLGVGLALNVFAMEYYFGLELARPLLLWFLLSTSSQPVGRRLLAVLRGWAPYLLVVGGYLFWRVVLFRSTRYGPEILEALAASPQSGLAGLAQSALQDIFRSAVLGWAQIFHSLADFSLDSLASLLYWGVVVAGAALLGAYLWHLERPQGSQAESGSQGKSLGQVLWLGGVSLVSAGLPFWSTGLRVELHFPYDRFTLPFIFGASLLLGGLLELLVRTERQKALLLALAFGFAAGWHFQNANTYRRDGENMRAFFGQLAWRAPAIQPGTLVMTHDLPLNYYSDNSLTGPLNWMYAPDQRGAQLPYMMFFIKARQGGSLTSTQPNTPVKKQIRSFLFTGNTSQTLLFYYSPPGCLRILDPSRRHELPALPVELAEALPLARPELIQADAPASARPPRGLFDPQPPDSWCTAFEQAELARQRADWPALAALAQAALAQYGIPAEPTELGVMIEGLARAGQIESALDWTAQTYRAKPLSAGFLCAEWSYLAAQGLVDQGLVDQVSGEIGCPGQ